MTTLDEFLEMAWAEHSDQPQQVADRLASSLHLVETPEQVAPFARLLVHVYGEHLGQWNAGVGVLNSLRSLAAAEGGQAAAVELDRGIATLRYVGGDSSVLQPLALEDRVSVLATASSALAGRQEFGQALAAYSGALQLADETLPSASAAHRALAVGGNNLAVALEEKNDRDGAETQGMLMAARGGLRHWKLAGTWLEHERAEYRLAKSLLQAAQAEAAVESAQRCVEVCEVNDAPAFEKFFGCAVLAIARHEAGDLTSFAAARTAALSWYEQVPDEDKQWCKSDLEELTGIATERSPA